MCDPFSEVVCDLLKRETFSCEFMAGEYNLGRA